MLYGTFKYGSGRYGSGRYGSLITNRTQTDVDALKALLLKGIGNMTSSELTAFLATGYKGGYNYTDYNRVGAAMSTLAGQLSDYGYPVSVTAKSDWTAGEEIDPAAGAAYLADIQTLKDAFYGTVTIPTTWAFITYTQANNIELLLLEIRTHISNMVAGFQECGVAICGSEVIL